MHPVVLLSRHQLRFAGGSGRVDGPSAALLTATSAPSPTIFGQHSPSENVFLRDDMGGSIDDTSLPSGIGIPLVALRDRHHYQHDNSRRRPRATPLTAVSKSIVSRWWIFERLMPLVQAPPQRQPPLRPDVVSCFFPGFTATRAQAAKYTGPDVVEVLDHDGRTVAYTAQCACAPRILHNVLPMREMHDVGFGVSLNPLTWPTLLLDGIRNRALRTSLSVSRHFHLRLNRFNIGGDVDQGECRAMIESAARQRSGRHLVVMGCSRGAATVLATVLKLERAVADAVALVIVEAPFDSVDHVVRATSWFPRLTLAALRVVGTYRGANDHPTPERAIRETTHVALQAPIAFVMSKADKRVPMAHTQRLVDLLHRHHPHVKTHELVLERSHHSAMSIADVEDRDRYVAFVEDLYRRYLPNEASTTS